MLVKFVHFFFLDYAKVSSTLIAHKVGGVEKLEMALRSRCSMKIFAIAGEMQESMGTTKT